MTRTKTPKLIRRLVNSSRNSKCNTARLEDLDWSNWWTDNTGGAHYLHVPHPTDETIHRVRCRLAKSPRLEMRDGLLFWLIP